MAEKRSPLVAFFEIKDWEIAYLKEPLGERFRLWFSAERLDHAQSDEWREAWGLSPFIYSKIDAALLNSLPSLKIIATRSTGFDHVDLDAARARSVVVANVPSYGENTVAEHTFGLILAVTRNIHKAHYKVTHRDFSLEGLEGMDIAGKTLGVIGTGRIGLHVIKIARGFGMKVLAYDIRQEPLLAEVLNFQYVPLETLLRESDIVTLHAPYNKHTHHMINAETLATMKQGAILINTARGGLVDTEALIAALDTGRLSGAGLDVLEGEQLLREEQQILHQHDVPHETLRTLLDSSILIRRPDVVVTPHIAFFSREAQQRILDTTIENLVRFHEGRPMNVVN
jgi:D-lactate dehydrogenase